MEREVFEKELEDLGLARRNPHQFNSLWQHGGPDTSKTVTFHSGESLSITIGDDAPRKEFFDPNNSGNPLLDVGQKYRETKLSEHFKVKELAQSGGKAFYKARIDPELVNCLEELRRYLKLSIRVIDGYYTYKHLEELLKKGLIKKIPENSPHLSGQGAKIDSRGVEGFTLAKAALFSCYGSFTTMVEVSLGELSIALYVGRKERRLSSYIRNDETRDKLVKKLQQYRDLYYDYGIPDEIQKGLKEGPNSKLRVEAMHGFVHWAIHVKGVQDETVIAEVLFYKTDFIQSRLRDISGLLDMRNKKDSDQYTSILDLFVRPVLQKVQGPIEQHGGEPQTAKGEFVISDPMPDNPKLDMTGRYEVIFQKNKYPILGRFMGINQAGNHIEAILTDVLSPRVAENSTRHLEKLNGELQNDGSFALMSREDRNIHHKLVPADNGFRIYFNNGNKYEFFSKYSSTPILRERALENYENSMGNSPARYFVQLQEWNPLLSNQMEHLLKYFGDPLNVDKFLQNFFSMPNIVKSREHHHGTAAASLDLAIATLLGDPNNGIHASDYRQARHYIQLLLTRKSWKLQANWPTMSQLDGIQRMVSIVEQEHKSKYWDDRIPYKIKNIQKWIVGPNLSTEPNVFEITFEKYGASGIVGGYTGTVTIEKIQGSKTWHPDPLKYPGGKVKFRFYLAVGSWGGGTAWGTSYTTKVSTQDDWLPEDFPGSLLIGWGEGGAQAYGVGVGAEADGLLIFGSAHFEPLLVKMGDVDYGLVPPALERDKGKTKVKKFDYGIGVTGGLGWISEKDEPISQVPPSKVERYYSIAYGIKKEAHFKFDSSILGDNARQALRVMCALELPFFLVPTNKLQIKAHTDSKGAEEYNLRLSEARAINTKQAIMDILGKALQIAPDAKGFGQEEAVKLDGDEVRNLDRRKVEVYLNGHLLLNLYDGNW
jgi:outer membrane protein OmpA-like peptidoglycan-associated protein